MLICGNALTNDYRHIKSINISKHDHDGLQDYVHEYRELETYVSEKALQHATLSLTEQCKGQTENGASHGLLDADSCTNQSLEHCQWKAFPSPNGPQRSRPPIVCRQVFHKKEPLHMLQIAT